METWGRGGAEGESPHAHPSSSVLPFPYSLPSVGERDSLPLPPSPEAQSGKELGGLWPPFPAPGGFPDGRGSWWCPQEELVRRAEASVNCQVQAGLSCYLKFMRMG